MVHIIGSTVLLLLFLYLTLEISQTIWELNLTYVPIFLGSRDQFEASETVDNQKIVTSIIHVERFIRKIKKFKILDGTIPLSLHGSINQTVCVLLTMFHNSIISA